MNHYSISCALHDHLEVACLYGYQIRLTLKDNKILEGKAIDTLTTAEKREYLLIDDGQKQQVELSDLKKLLVLTPHAQFKEIDF